MQDLTKDYLEGLRKLSEEDKLKMMNALKRKANQGCRDTFVVEKCFEVKPEGAEGEPLKMWVWSCSRDRVMFVPVPPDHEKWPVKPLQKKKEKTE